MYNHTPNSCAVIVIKKIEQILQIMSIAIFGDFFWWNHSFQKKFTGKRTIDNNGHMKGRIYLNILLVDCSRKYLRQAGIPLFFKNITSSGENTSVT